MISNYFCKKCHSRLVIDNVVREDNNFTATLKCLNDKWYHRHTKLVLYSNDSGATWFDYETNDDTYEWQTTTDSFYESIGTLMGNAMARKRDNDIMGLFVKR